jgi:hypothetical protein
MYAISLLTPRRYYVRNPRARFDGSGRSYFVNGGGTGDGGTGTGTGSGSGDSKTGDNKGDTDKSKSSDGGDGDKDKSKDGDKDADKDKDKSKSKDDENKFTQADIDKAIQTRLEREKSNQEKESLKKQGEFEKLYNDQQPEFVRLQGVETEYKALAETLHSTIDTSIKDWDADLKESDPGKGDLNARQKWFQATAKIQAKLAGNNTSTVNGEHGKKGDGKETTAVDSFISGRYTVPTAK